MTMLAAVSVPEGIVLSADSCITLQKNGQDSEEMGTIQGEKLFVVGDALAFMTYGDADCFYNFEVKYAHELSLYGQRRRSQIGGGDLASVEKKYLSPSRFMDYMIKERKPYEDYIIPRDKRSKDYRTGIVIGGYENGNPKVYTFVKGASKRAFECEKDTYNIPNLNSEVTYVTKATKQYPNEELEYSCYEGYFGLCFATTEYIKNSNYEEDFSKMKVKDAVIYSRKLIEDTIEKMKQRGEELSVNYPIDTVVIRRESVEWKRYTKTSDPIK